MTEETLEKPTETLVEHLEKSGVLDEIAESIVNLYTTPKPPPEIFNYFLQTMKVESTNRVEKLLTDNQELRRKITSLKAQIAELESRSKK
jgi:predicted RNase H-like nuclease (RuvC/YqgF family)